MNFKTTILLIALLLIAGVTVYFVHEQPPASTEAPSSTKNLLAISQDDVTKVSIMPADGSPLVLEHTGSNWTITQPVHAKADTFTAGDLVREICELQSHAQVGADVATGVDHPNYRVELTTKDGKTTTLNFGAKSDVGDNLYVRVDGRPKVNVVSADVQSYLDKTVNDYRDMNLVAATPDTIQRVEIAPATSVWYLERIGGKWQIERTWESSIDALHTDVLPTESSAVDDFLSTLTTLRAASFVDHPLPAAMYQFNKPQLVVKYWTTPAGSIASTRPAEKEIVFGGYEDVRKQNVFARVDGEVVKIAASTMDSLNKSPLDLRDRTLVDIDPATVAQIELKKNMPASTQPIKRAASNVDLVIARSAKPRATSRPSTQPSPVWMFPINKTAKVDANNVNDVLASLHPLKVEKYLEKLPTPLPSDHFHVVVTSGGKNYDFDFYATAANETNATGSYDGAIFEVPNTFIDHLRLDFGWEKK